MAPSLAPPHFPSQVPLAQLPPAVPDFTGREAQLLRTSALLTTAPAPVVAITGPGGIGKTALALHTAHQSRKHFPDGQLYADLRAGRPNPMDLSGLPARILRDMGTTTGRRLLIVLDDVPEPGVTRPLLTALPPCPVLLTSRHEGWDEEEKLGELTREEVWELFTRIVGAHRVAAEPEAAAALLDSCAGFPATVRSRAMALARRPGWNIAAVVERLSGLQRAGARLSERSIRS